MLLTPYRTDLWLCSYPVRLARAKFDARMTAIRLASGDMMLHSPCQITTALAGEISALGRVAHIVVPGNFHHMHTISAQRTFPHAKTWICPSIERKRPELRYDGVLGDLAPTYWDREIDQVLVRGSRIVREVAMYHRASRTLILVDLIENFTDSTPNIGGALKFWFKYVMRMWGKPAPAPEYRIGWNDRIAASDSLRRILAWDFQQIVLSHGDLIDHDAHAVAAQAWSGILDR